MDNKYEYIYNLEQADFYLKLGLIPKGIGRGKFKDIYIKFEKTDKLKEVFSIWCELGKEKINNK